ncbi:hypothetical protein ACSQ67_021044 [Phaseolus vulgaris]
MLEARLSTTLTNLEACKAGFYDLGVQDYVLPFMSNNVTKLLSSTLALNKVQYEEPIYKDGFPTWVKPIVLGDGFVAQAITFRNTAGYQDTLYVHYDRNFYGECDIYGTIDFIFGNVVVVFKTVTYMQETLQTKSTQSLLKEEPIQTKTPAFPFTILEYNCLRFVTSPKLG